MVLLGYIGFLFGVSEYEVSFEVALARGNVGAKTTGVGDLVNAILALGVDMLFIGAFSLEAFSAKLTEEWSLAVKFVAVIHRFAMLLLLEKLAEIQILRVCLDLDN